MLPARCPTDYPRVAPAVQLRPIRAHDLNLDHIHTLVPRHVSPHITGDRNRVDAISNHRPSQSEIVSREFKCGTVSRAIAVVFSTDGRTDRLLDCVDRPMHSADLKRQLACEGRFADAGKTAERDQHDPNTTAAGSIARVCPRVVGRREGGSVGRGGSWVCSERFCRAFSQLQSRTSNYYDREISSAPRGFQTPRHCLNRRRPLRSGRVVIGAHGSHQRDLDRRAGTLDFPPSRHRRGTKREGRSWFMD
jgi:hypothetical protein